LVSLGLGPLNGFGEAPAIHYYGVSTESMAVALEKVRPVIERYALMDPQRFWHFLHHLLPGENFLVAALDMAGWDLFGKMRRQPLHRLLSFDISKAPITDYTLGHDSVEKMAEKMKAMSWPIYKIKVRTPDDIDVLRALRTATTSAFRLDANEGWIFDDTRRLLPELQALGVELLEQPLPRGEWEAMKELKATSPIPLVADESCVEERDVARCAEGFHAINIKLTKCSGITPAMRMIAEARTLGLRVMLGSMNESTVGTAALAHLAPAVDFLDADGPLLLAEDLAEGLVMQDAHWQVSSAPGLGIRTWSGPRQKP
jgi:L-alanine-DL-glutamate epimerase-like enolase superfamily enzyme